MRIDRVVINSSPLITLLTLANATEVNEVTGEGNALAFPVFLEFS